MAFKATQFFQISNSNLNLVPQSSPSVWGYITSDTAAQVGAANYFAPQFNYTQPSGFHFNVGDLVLASCSDGPAQFIFTSAKTRTGGWLTEQIVGGGEATRQLDNLTGVAINTTLVSDTDVTDDLGTLAIRWNNVFAANLSTGDTAADTLEISAYDVDGAASVPFITLTAGNTPTCVLEDGVTATTQTPGDNSTKVATTAYVDATGGADVSLNNLAGVAINTSLVSDTDITDDLGTAALRWRNVYTGTVQAGDTAADTLTLGAYDVDGTAYVPFITMTSNNTPTCALEDGVTATTQSAGDNSTLVATTAYADAIEAAKANVALDNLAAVAINTSLVSDTDITDDLGTQAIRWNNVYAATLQTGDTAADTLTMGAWDVDGAAYVPFITMTANNTPTCVLEDGVTATTQAPADNSTLVATTAYVDSATGGGAGANAALSNLASVAINTSLISDTDITDDLGSLAIRWNNVYAATVQSGDTAADTLTLGAYDVDGAAYVPFITMTSNNTPTCALEDGVTATTQAPADNSTLVATTAYADAAAAAAGDVVGPASATDEAIARFDSTTGKLLQNSVGILTDAGALSGLTQLDVDNIRVDGNAITSTDTNGNITLTPDGTGEIVLDGLSWPTADGTASQVLQTDGAGQLSFATASGGGGACLQFATASTGSVSSGTTVIPADDTVPQNSEGFEVLTVSITPTSATSTLVISMETMVARSASTPNCTMALFRDSTASALAATATTFAGDNLTETMVLQHSVAAGSTSATTFKMRVGPSSGATITVNGVGGSTRRYGGVAGTFISVYEMEN